MLTGCTMLALGLVLMKSAGIVTAGVAGIALLLSYHVPLGVGLLFFLINIPFLLLGMRVLGREFLIKTTLAILLIFGLATLARASMDIAWVHPAFAALVGGTCSGMGVLALVRHNTGVGGVNIIALWAQKTRGVNIGRLHMVLDGAILLVAATSLSLAALAWSALSVVAMNLVLVAYHKPDRYLGY
ncbi:MAG: YitT family protein [Sphingomonadales bacterium]|nr:YitT family protein [Sphingomonadales bacterium]MBD3773981.1 YitT family protein [Paracoccaceae bacterium]